jgi:hypothetical protein
MLLFIVILDISKVRNKGIHLVLNNERSSSSSLLAAYKLLVFLYSTSAQLVKEWKTN